MSEISISSIGTLRYAPAGAADVRAFNYNGVKEMTLGQLMMALCIRRGAQLEELCVNAMNRLSLGTDQLERLTGYAQEVLNGNNDLYVSTIRPYLIDHLDFKSDDLLASLDAFTDHPDAYQNRMAVYEQMQSKLAMLDTDNSRLAVDLQTAVGRRDVTYNTASSTVLGLGKSALACANALKVRK